MLKAQLSFEMTWVVGTIMFALMIVILVQTNIFGVVNNELTAATVSTTLDQVLEASELVYKQGRGAKTQVRVQIPKNVKSGKITGGAVTYVVSESGRNSTIAKEKTIPINGSLPTKEGAYTLVLENKKNYVKLSY